MSKSKVTGIAVVLVFLAVIFTGCRNDGGDGDNNNISGSSVKVTGVSLSASVGSNSSSTIYLNSTSAAFPASVTFTPIITPANAANKAVTWTVTPATYVDWDEETLTVTAKALGGPTTITVKTVDGNRTAAWTVTVADPASYVAVTGVSIDYAEASLAFTKDGDDFSPASIQLGHTVLPANATNKAVSWSVEPDGVVTVADGLVTPVGAGSAVITLASVDKPEIKDAINVSVTEEGGGTEPSEYELKLVNLGTPAGTTTTTMPEMDATTKRYTIRNDISTAKFASAGLTDVTIVYLDYPADQFSSISARVRIKKSNGGVATETGVIMGLMTNPAQPIAARGVNFAGMRVNNAGLWRPYTSRPNITTPSNNSAALAVQNASGYGEINSNANSAIDGVAIPYDEEFIIEAARTGTRTNNTAGVYTTRLYTNAVNISSATLMASYSTGNNDDIDISTTGKPAYLGFIIANCDVEISQIVIKETTNEIFSTSPSTPTPTPVANVQFTAPSEVQETTPGEYIYTHSTAGGMTLALNAKALPNRAPAADKIINWSVVSGPATLDVNTGDSVTATFTASTGTVVITASAGGKSAQMTITVISAAIEVNEITISAAGGKTSIMAGVTGDNAVPPETLQFSAEVGPGNAANKNVTWSISDTSAFGGGNTSGCTIDATGLLTAPANYTGGDFDIYVFAKAVDTGGFTSAGTTITVKGYVAPPAGPTVQKASLQSSKTDTSYTTATGILKMTGTGASDSNGVRGNFVYIELDTTVDFTATVKLHSFTAAAHNNSKVGIVVMGGTAAPNPTGVWYSCAVNNTANPGEVVEYYTGRNSLNAGDANHRTLSYPGYLRLTKSGNNFQCFASNNGTAWGNRAARSITIPTGEKMYLGLFVSSNANDGVAEFSTFTIDLNDGKGPITINLGNTPTTTIVE